MSTNQTLCRHDLTCPDMIFLLVEKCPNNYFHALLYSIILVEENFDKLIFQMYLMGKKLTNARFYKIIF